MLQMCWGLIKYLTGVSLSKPHIDGTSLLQLYVWWWWTYTNIVRTYVLWASYMRQGQRSHENLRMLMSYHEHVFRLCIMSMNTVHVTNHICHIERQAAESESKERPGKVPDNMKDYQHITHEENRYKSTKNCRKKLRDPLVHTATLSSGRNEIPSRKVNWNYMQLLHMYTQYHCLLHPLV